MLAKTIATNACQISVIGYFHSNFGLKALPPFTKDPPCPPPHHSKIAVIAGDGIGKEVMPEGLRVLQAAAQRFGPQLDITPIAWASCDYYAAHGKNDADDWKAQLSGMDAIFFGAVGWPAAVPDHVSLWGSLLKFRREFDQYINLRPVRLFDGVPCPLAGRKRRYHPPGGAREHRGRYTSWAASCTKAPSAKSSWESVISRQRGAELLLKFAFDLAQSRPQTRHPGHQSNGIAISMPWWDQRAEEVAQKYPDVALDKQHIDILTARFVLQPGRFDVVAATNLFGDILSDLGPATTGTIGLAPSANLNPERLFPSLFEPCTARRPTSTARTSPTRLPWSGRAR